MILTDTKVIYFTFDISVGFRQPQPSPLSIGFGFCLISYAPLLVLGEGLAPDIFNNNSGLNYKNGINYYLFNSKIIMIKLNRFMN